MSSQKHKKQALKNIKTGIITVSTSRTLATDKSGKWINKQAKKERHTIACHTIIPDNQSSIRSAVCDAINTHALQVLIVTGGTGLSPTDVTIEAVRPLFKKELTSFGPAVTQLSLEEIDSAAILSRATAGIIGKAVVFCLPGSINACKLICQTLIFPEAGHIAKHLIEQ